MRSFRLFWWGTGLHGLCGLCCSWRWRLPAPVPDRLPAWARGHPGIQAFPGRHGRCGPWLSWWAGCLALNSPCVGEFVDSLSIGKIWGCVRGFALGPYPSGFGGGLGGGGCFSSGKHNSLRSDIFFPARKTRPTSRRQTPVGGEAQFVIERCVLDGLPSNHFVRRG